MMYRHIETKREQETDKGTDGERERERERERGLGWTMNDVPTKTVAPIVRPEGEKERERERERERQRETVLQGAWRVDAPPPPTSWPGCAPFLATRGFLDTVWVCVTGVNASTPLSLRTCTVLGPGWTEQCVHVCMYPRDLRSLEWETRQ